MASGNITSSLDSPDFQSWECGSIDIYIQGQEPMIVCGGVGSDQEVRESATCAQVAMLAAPFRISSERSASRPPYRFGQMPVDRDPGIFKEPIHEIFSSTGTRYQFRKDRGSDGYISLPKG